jgi:hypothetical protein
MADWLNIISNRYAEAVANDGDELLLSPGATREQIDQRCGALGFVPPSDFRELYATCNGFGVRELKQPDTPCWFFYPLEQMSEFCERIRAGFAETHPEEAARFFPFIDFEDGDGVGYCVDEEGQLLEGLFLFEHEAYEGEEDQEPSDFLVRVPMTVQQFLMQL